MTNSQENNEHFSESRLIKEICKGNEKAYEELFFEYYYQLCRFTVKITNCSELARDSVQEVFFKIWKNKENWKVRHSLKAYLYQAVRNHALNMVEQQRIRQRLSARLKEEEEHVLPPVSTITGGDKPEKDMSMLVIRIWELVEDYLCTDGLPITLSPLYQGDDQIEDVFENRDPRLRQSILHPEDSELYKYHNADDRDYPRIDGMSGGRLSTTGYHVVKHYNADDMIGKAFNQGEHPGIILRFGEVLLNYAEARAELNDITQEDLDMSINLLRDRVDMPHMVLGNIPVDPRYTGDGVSPLIIEIRRERRVELFLEGFRYNDLRRWGQGNKLENPDMGIRWNEAAAARYEGADIRTAVDPESGNTYIDVYQGSDWADPVFDESRHYLWPIPISALSQNPDIGQNPGW